jgi:hypothetical protein
MMTFRFTLAFLAVVALGSRTLMAADSTGPAPETPYNGVLKAKMFAIGGVGFAGTTSAEEKAFRSMLAAPDARDQLGKLVKRATPAGQLYALLGLKLMKDPSYKVESPRLIKDTTPVTTMTGCVISQQTAGSLARAIADGRYDAKREGARPEGDDDAAQAPASPPE